jgi:MreB/Mbl protein
MGGIVVWESVRVGGYELDEALVRHLDANAHLLIGPETAEGAKIACGAAWPLPEKIETDVAGHGTALRACSGGRRSTRARCGPRSRSRSRRSSRRSSGRSNPRRPSLRATSGTAGSCSPAAAHCCAVSTSSSARRQVCRSSSRTLHSNVSCSAQGPASRRLRLPDEPPEEAAFVDLGEDVGDVEHEEPADARPDDRAVWVPYAVSLRTRGYPVTR